MHFFDWKTQAYATIGLFLLFHTAGAWSHLPSRWLGLPNQDACEKNPYCTRHSNGTFSWTNDCNFPMPSYESWKKNRFGDTSWLRKHFKRYMALKGRNSGLAKDELTFSTYMLKRFAPNASPNSMLCDGLGGMCSVSISHGDSFDRC